MKIKLTSLALALTLLGTSACYRATFYRDPSVTRAAEHEQWTDFFIFGLVGSEDFDVHQFCPSGDVAVVQTGGNFGTGIVSVLTIGIYTPRKVYVTCAQATAARVPRSLELDLDARGRPRAASARLGARDLRLNISAAEPGAWRVTERGQ